jgi:predicted transcriptional regulator
MITDSQSLLFSQIEQALKQDEAFRSTGDYLLFNEDEAILLLSDLFEKRGTIILVLGKRGSGKTAWAIRSAELAQTYFYRKVATYLLEYPGIKTYYDLKEIENGSYVVIDEAELFLHSRRSLAKQNVNFSQLLAISRHKDLTLVFVSQASNLVDRSIIQLADYLIFKEPGMFSIELERTGLADLFIHATTYFASLPESLRKKVYLTYSDEVFKFLWKKFQHYTRYFGQYYVYSVLRRYSIIKAMNELPSNWNEKISKSFADYDVMTSRIDNKFSQLPDRFTWKDVMELFNVSEATARRYIKRWRESKMVKRIKRGTYEKIKK